MKGQGILLIIAVFLVILKIKSVFIVHNGWIIGCFVLWFILFYIGQHKKNKEASTPKPVYIID